VGDVHALRSPHRYRHHQKAWASKRDPLFLPGNFNNRILIDACIPYDKKLKGTFPVTVDVSADLRRSLRSKFPQLFPKH
jgi:hypothetical protein